MHCCSITMEIPTSHRILALSNHVTIHSIISSVPLTLAIDLSRQRPVVICHERALASVARENNCEVDSNGSSCMKFRFPPHKY
jgi:hypothetical protein